MLHRVAPEPARYRVETKVGSVLLAQQGIVEGDKILLMVSGLGKVRLDTQELRFLEFLK